MPSFEIWGACMEDRVCLAGLMLDEGGIGGEDVEAFRAGQGASHESRVALVRDPTPSGIEVRGVIPALVECHNGYKAHAGVRDVEHVSQFQHMTWGDA